MLILETLELAFGRQFIGQFEFWAIGFCHQLRFFLNYVLLMCACVCSLECDMGGYTCNGTCGGQDSFVESVPPSTVTLILGIDLSCQAYMANALPKY